MVSIRTGSLAEQKKDRSSCFWRFLVHALFLGAFFGALGQFLVEYRFLRPEAELPQTVKIEIQATGAKNEDSKSAEVWFYGAFRLDNNEKIPWDRFSIDTTWEKRDDIYISYKAQPSTAILTYEEPIRLSFGSHPYAGIVKLEKGGQIEIIDLYAKSNQVKSIAIDLGPTYKNTGIHFLILLISIGCGISLAAAFVFLGWKNVYRLIFFLALIFSIYLTLAAYFPGVYTNDSMDQLRQALTNKYGDWHPPIMAWVWSLLIGVTGKTESLLMFHMMLLTAGAIFWRKIFECLRVEPWALLIPVLLASPIVINFSGVMWKDVGFAFSLFLSCGIVGLASVENRISRIRVIAVLALVAYAFGVRSNGIFAIFPIVVLLAWLIVGWYKPMLSRAAAIALAATGAMALLIVVVLGVQLFSYKYINAERRYPIQYLELYDIAGISSASGIDYFPEYVKQWPDYNINKITEGYANSISWGNANSLFFRGSNGSSPLIPLNSDAELQDELRTSWLKAIFAEPMAYLKHRFAVVNFLMSKGYYPSEQPQSHTTRKSLFDTQLGNEATKFSSYSFPGTVGVKDFVSSSLAQAKGSFLYVGWFWLILLTVQLLIGLLIMKSRKSTRAGQLIAMVSASGMLYILPYSIVAPASDFRYLYWSALAGGISAILIMALAIGAAKKMIDEYFYNARRSIVPSSNVNASTPVG